MKSNAVDDLLIIMRLILLLLINKRCLGTMELHMRGTDLEATLCVYIERLGARCPGILLNLLHSAPS